MDCMFEEGIHSYPTICSSLHITYLPKMPDQLYTRMSSRSLMQALPRASEYMHSIAIPALSLCLYSLCMHTPQPHILSLSLSLSLSVHIPTQVAGRKGFPHVIYVCEDFCTDQISTRMNSAMPSIANMPLTWSVTMCVWTHTIMREFRHKVRLYVWMSLTTCLVPSGIGVHVQRDPPFNLVLKVIGQWWTGAPMLCCVYEVSVK